MSKDKQDGQQPNKDSTEIDGIVFGNDIVGKKELTEADLKNPESQTRRRAEGLIAQSHLENKKFGTLISYSECKKRYQEGLQELMDQMKGMNPEKFIIAPGFFKNIQKKGVTEFMKENVLWWNGKGKVPEINDNQFLVKILSPGEFVQKMPNSLASGIIDNQGKYTGIEVAPMNTDEEWSGITLLQALSYKFANNPDSTSENIAISAGVIGAEVTSGERIQHFIIEYAQEGIEALTIALEDQSYDRLLNLLEYIDGETQNNEVSSLQECYTRAQVYLHGFLYAASRNPEQKDDAKKLSQEVLSAENLSKISIAWSRERKNIQIEQKKIWTNAEWNSALQDLQLVVNDILKDNSESNFVGTLVNRKALEMNKDVFFGSIDKNQDMNISAHAIYSLAVVDQSVLDEMGINDTFGSLYSNNKDGRVMKAITSDAVDNQFAIVYLASMLGMLHISSHERNEDHGTQLFFGAAVGGNVAEHLSGRRFKQAITSLGLTKTTNFNDIYVGRGNVSMHKIVEVLDTSLGLPRSMSVSEAHKRIEFYMNAIQVCVSAEGNAPGQEIILDLKHRPEEAKKRAEEIILNYNENPRGKDVVPAGTFEASNEIKCEDTKKELLEQLEHIKNKDNETLVKECVDLVNANWIGWSDNSTGSINENDPQYSQFILNFVQIKKKISSKEDYSFFSAPKMGKFGKVLAMLDQSLISTKWKTVHTLAKILTAAELIKEFKNGGSTLPGAKFHSKFQKQCLEITISLFQKLFQKDFIKIYEEMDDFFKSKDNLDIDDRVSLFKKIDADLNLEPPLSFHEAYQRIALYEPYIAGCFGNVKPDGVNLDFHDTTQLAQAYFETGNKTAQNNEFEELDNEALLSNYIDSARQVTAGYTSDNLLTQQGIELATNLQKFGPPLDLEKTNLAKQDLDPAPHKNVNTVYVDDNPINDWSDMSAFASRLPVCKNRHNQLSIVIDNHNITDTWSGIEFIATCAYALEFKNNFPEVMQRMQAGVANKTTIETTLELINHQSGDRVMPHLATYSRSYMYQAYKSTNAFVGFVKAFNELTGFETPKSKTEAFKRIAFMVEYLEFKNREYGYEIDFAKLNETRKIADQLADIWLEKGELPSTADELTLQEQLAELTSCADAVSIGFTPNNEYQREGLALIKNPNRVGIQKITSLVIENGNLKLAPSPTGKQFEVFIDSTVIDSFSKSENRPTTIPSGIDANLRMGAPTATTQEVFESNSKNANTTKSAYAVMLMGDQPFSVEWTGYLYASFCAEAIVMSQVHTNPNFKDLISGADGNLNVFSQTAYDLMNFNNNNQLDTYIKKLDKAKIKRTVRFKEHLLAYLNECDDTISAAPPMSKTEAFKRIGFYSDLLLLEIEKRGIEIDEDVLNEYNIIIDEIIEEWFTSRTSNNEDLDQPVDGAVFKKWTKEKGVEQPQERNPETPLKPNDKARIIEVVTEVLATLTEGGELTKKASKLYSTAKNKLSAPNNQNSTVRAFSNMVKTLKAVQDRLPIETWFEYETSLPKQIRDDIGEINERWRTFKGQHPSVNTWVQSLVSTLSNKAFPVKNLEKISARDIKKLLWGLSTLLDEFFKEFGNSPGITNLKQAVMLGVTRTIKQSPAGEQLSELEFTKATELANSDELEKYFHEIGGPLFQTKTTENYNTAQSQVNKLNQLLKTIGLETLEASDVLPGSNSSATSVVAENLAHYNDDVVLLSMVGGKPTYVRSNPFEQWWEIGVPDKAGKQAMLNRDDITLLKSTTSSSVVMPDGTVLDRNTALESARFLAEPTSGDYKEKADHVRGTFNTLRTGISQLYDQYPVIANRHFLGARIFIEDGEKTYLLLEKGKRTAAKALFDNSGENYTLKDLELRDDAKRELLRTFNIDSLDKGERAQWIAIELPAEVFAPVKMENPFKGVVLGSDAAKGFGSRGGGGKRIKEETREEQIQAEWTEDSRVIAQVELLSNLSAEMNLNMSAKPGKHDSTMYRFARLRGNKVMRPENFYSGYWRVKIVDPNNSNRTLRLGVCDLKGEGAYIMFDKNTPDDAFEGSGSKSRLQHQHGGVLVPFSGAANWQAEMQHILKKFFDNGSRYYSLGHLDGRPELYNSNKPEMRTTLRKDLINVANQLYGTIGPMQKTNPRQRAQHETSLVQQLTVEDFKNRIPENFDFGFRGVGGGKSGESILENFAVYLGLTTKVHRNAESAVINGARTESERVEDAKYNSILQEALDELKRLAFGIQKPKNPHYKQHVVEDETEVDIIDKYLAEVGINKGINDARLKVGAKPLSKAELARIRVENYNGAASGFIDLEHGQQILDEENKKD